VVVVVMLKVVGEAEAPLKDMTMGDADSGF